ncbi:hypothetical protein, partial [Robiginitalea aurantiaca]
MTKRLLFRIIPAFLAFVALYLLSRSSEPGTSDYELLANAGYKKSDARGLFGDDYSEGGLPAVSSGSKAGPSDAYQFIRTTLLEAAIPVVPVGKFLNGNMPVTTPDDVNGPFAPALLSQTGAFSDMINLTVSPGV